MLYANHWGLGMSNPRCQKGLYIRGKVKDLKMVFIHDYLCESTCESFDQRARRLKYQRQVKIEAMFRVVWL